LATREGISPCKLAGTPLLGEGANFLSPGPESVLGGPAGVLPCEVNDEMNIPKIPAVLKGDFV